MLPLPMMTKGLLAAFRTDTASAIEPWSATLTGGGGQQDTTLQEKHSSLRVFTPVTTRLKQYRKTKCLKCIYETNLTLLLST